MTKIQRTKQEIFANQAGSRQITAFGTAKNENPTFTNDVSQIQNNNFLQGWLSALLPDKAPWEEDMNALFYVITKQLAYLFQEGIAEYNSTTEYSKNSLVKAFGGNTIYYSLTDNNIGNNLSDTNYWQIYFNPQMFSEIDDQVEDLKQYVDTQIAGVKSSINTSLQKVVPDYSRRVNVPYPTYDTRFTAPTNGVYIATLGQQNRVEYLYINGIKTDYALADGATGSTYSCFTVPLSKGDVIWWSGWGIELVSGFYPYKNA